MSKQKIIDYLTEDRPIPGQKYALISVVGPNYKQNCDIYAIKIRGFANTEGEAKKITQSIMKYDNNFDIYTAPVGLFFPLDVDPKKVKNVEYANSQLNSLIKNYTENRIEADNQFHIRKQEMIKQAIKEGKSSEEKPEHPVSVLGRINDLSAQIKEQQNIIENLENDLELANTKFNNFTQDEQQEAQNIIEKGVTQELQNKENTQKETRELEQVVVDTFTNDFKQQQNTFDLDEFQKILETEPIKNTLDSIQTLESKIQEITESLEIINSEKQPNTYQLLYSQKQTLETQKTELVQLLNQSNTSEFINSKFDETTNIQFMNS